MSSYALFPAGATQTLDPSIRIDFDSEVWPVRKCIDGSDPRCSGTTPTLPIVVMLGAQAGMTTSDQVAGRVEREFPPTGPRLHADEGGPPQDCSSA